MMQRVSRYATRRISIAAVAAALSGLGVGACNDVTGPVMPTAPTGVTVTMLTPSSARVSWMANPADEGIVEYSVFRNGVTIGKSASTTYVDDNLVELTTYKYSVAAVGAGGTSSPQSVESASATITAPDVTLPRVTANDPASGSPAVASAAVITVTFSEAMDASTITAAAISLKLTSSGAPIAGVVSYVAATRVAELRPSSALPSGAGVTATVSTAVKDAAGNALAAPHVWTFTVRDETAPSVTASSPANGATSVATSTTITATFSESMDASTINSSTVLLRLTSSGAAVPGVVTYNAASRVATFTPGATLATSAGHTLTITTGVKDLAGNSLAAAFSSSFSTAAPLDNTSPAVTAVSPGNGAANVAVGVSVTVTFSEAIDAATLTASTFNVAPSSGGSALAGTVSYNAGSNSATFVAASPFGAGASYTVRVTSAVRDLAGNALANAFSSSFTTAAPVDNTAPSIITASPADGSTGVATGTTISVTFSEPMNAATINAASFTLRANATGALVAGTVAYNPATRLAAFTPSALAPGTEYTATVTTAARDLAGNAIGGDFSFSFTTAVAADVTAPTVTTVSPAGGTTGVAIGTSIAVTFSEQMNPATISSSSVTLDGPGGGVNGNVTCNGDCTVATFVPATNLGGNTSYTISVATSVTDLAGNALGGQFTSSFTTLQTDVVAPTVLVTDPAPGGTGVAVNKILTATFSKSMDPATINGSTFTLRNTATGAPVEGIVTYNAATNTAGFNVQSPLSNGTNYTATVTTGARDASGNALGANVVFAFTTVPLGDTTPPSVSSVSPAAGATGVATTVSASITFNEAMDGTTVNGSTVTLSSGEAAVAGSVSYNGETRTATFTPSAALAQNTTYTITATTGAKDLAGNALAANFSASFTTAAPAGDNVAPTVVSSNPANGATGVATATTVTVSFSEPMDAATVNGSTLTLGSGAGAVAGSVSYNSGTNAGTFTPSSALAANTVYTVTITTGAKDAAGNSLGANFTSSFTTVAPAGDNVAPTIVSLTPVNREKSAPPSSPVVVFFSESMDPATINGSTLKLIGAAGDIGTSVAYNAGNNSASFAPSGGLLPNSCYRAVVTTGVKDAAGNALQTERSVSFTTSANGSPPTKSTCGHWGGTSTGAFMIHLHVFLTQTGSVIGKRDFCVPSTPTLIPECRMYAYNQAAADVMGLPSGDPNAAQNLRVSGITGNFTEPGSVTLQLTLENGKVFTFTGTIGAGPPGVEKTMEGFITGIGIPGPGAPIRLDWYPNIQ